MGTNFYLRRKLSQEEKQHIINSINNDNWNEVRDCLPEDIHIGKRSAGWKFLWDAHYFKYFKPSKEALFEWLKSGQIIDEYGRKFTFDQFINDEIVNFINNGYTAESYYKEHPRTLNYYSSIIDQFKINCSDFKEYINHYGEFFIDNLRFTVSEDFS